MRARLIKFLNPDQVQTHTGFHHFMEIGKICHNKNIFINNNNNNNKLSKLKLRDEIIRWFGRLHSWTMDWPISCLNPSYPESYTEEIWVQSGMRLLSCWPLNLKSEGDPPGWGLIVWGEVLVKLVLWSIPWSFTSSQAILQETNLHYLLHSTSSLTNWPRFWKGQLVLVQD